LTHNTGLAKMLNFITCILLILPLLSCPTEAVPIDAELPNDASFFRQWGLEQINDVDVDIVTAWEMLRDRQAGLTPITVAVADGSIELDGRNEFTGRTVPGCDITEAYQRLGSAEAITPNECRKPKLELNAHGNGVAGIIAANYNNSFAISGVAGPYPVSIMPLHSYLADILVIPQKGAEDNEHYLAAAVKFAADNGARVFCTANGYNPGDVDVDVMKDAFEYANEKGMLIVVSAGNTPAPGDPETRISKKEPLNQDILPGSLRLPNIISVGSINMTGHLAADWNGSGLAFQDNTYYGRNVDIAAPGTAIVTTDGHVVTDALSELFCNDGYCDYGQSGNSYASPFVAGIAALTLTAYPELSLAQLRDAIMSGVQQTEELMTEVCYCENDPHVQLKSCTDLCGEDDMRNQTRLVQSGGYIRAPLVLVEAARLLGESIDVNGNPIESYPKAAFSVQVQGESPEDYVPKWNDIDITDVVRNWKGLEVGDGDEVLFSAKQGVNYRYAWDFGDGTSSSDRNPTHIYPTTGEFLTKLIVTDKSTGLEDATPPLRVVVYRDDADHVKITSDSKGLFYESYLLHSDFKVLGPNLFGDYRIEGSGYFEVDGEGYSVTVNTGYPFLGVSYKYVKVEQQTTGIVIIPPKWAWTLGGIEYKEFEDGTESMIVEISPYQFVLTLTS